MWTLRLARQHGGCLRLNRDDLDVRVLGTVVAADEGAQAREELLLDERLPDPAGGYASIVARSSEHLLSIVNSILEYSRVDQVDADPAHAAFSLRGTIEDVMAIGRGLLDGEEARTAEKLLAQARHNIKAKSKAEQLRAAAAEYGKKVEVVTYPDAPHAFCNDMKPDSYRSDLTTQAWERSAVFLKTCFQGT